MPDIRFRVTEWQDKTVQLRLLELYQHDLSEIWPKTLNLHGDFTGFGLVDSSVSLPESEFWMGQFFVMKRYRRTAAARCAGRRSPSGPQP